MVGMVGSVFASRRLVRRHRFIYVAVTGVVLSERAIEQGVLACLEVYDSPLGFKCGCCRQRQPPGIMVFVPVDVCLGDDLAFIYAEAGRNGACDFWCVFCARKLNSPPPPTFDRPGWFARIYSRFFGT